VVSWKNKLYSDEKKIDKLITECKDYNIFPIFLSHKKKLGVSRATVRRRREKAIKQLKKIIQEGF